MNLSKFRRITSGGNIIPEIDGLRFIAILSVMMLHCADIIYGRVADANLIYPDPQIALLPPVLQHRALLLRFLNHGHYGVEVFFVISGFILALPFARHYICGDKPVRYSTYLLRRVTRLEPPYLVSLLLRTALWIILGTYPLRMLLVHLFYSSLYLHGFRYGHASLISNVAWSLETEVQFYLLAPFISKIFALRGAWTRRLLLVAAILICTPIQQALIPNWTLWVRGGVWDGAITNFLQFFLAGLLVADFFVDGWERIPTTWFWDLICIPGWVLLFWVNLVPFHYIAPLLLPVLFIGAFKGRLVRAFIRIPLVSVIGGMCYSIYLTHFTILSIAMKLPLHLRLPIDAQLAFGFLVAIPLAVIFGAIYFRLLERPCMDRYWPQKLWSRLTGAPKAVPASR